MPEPVLFDHIDLRVKSLAAVTPFYDALMGALGLVRITPDGEDDWAGYAYARKEPISTPFFGLIEEPGHHPDATRIALSARTREDVDRAAGAALAAGALAMEGPELCAEYHPTYYACFFDDPDGNHLEVVCHE